MAKGIKCGPGGAGTGGTLTVNAPVGVTVTATKDGKTKAKTANALGVAVFKGLASGTWSVTITDGSQANTQQTTINADYSMIISFFSATIDVTYPAGSTCTCTDGTTTLTAPDTNGKWTVTVPNAGTWTVFCTNGTDNDSVDVDVTMDGQNNTVELDYWQYLDGSNQYERITGGWIIGGSNASKCSITDDGIYLEAANNTAFTAYAATKNPIDFSGVNKLLFEVTEIYHFNLGDTNVLSIRTDPSINGGTELAKYSVTTKQPNTFELDVSGLQSTSGYIVVKVANTSKMTLKSVRGE